MKPKRSPPADRKAALLAAALWLAERGNYRTVTRQAIAERAGVSPGLVSFHLGTVKNMKRDVMRAAVHAECLPIIAQGLAVGDTFARKAPDRVRHAAVATLVKPG